MKFLLFCLTSIYIAVSLFLLSCSKQPSDRIKLTNQPLGDFEGSVSQPGIKITKAVHDFGLIAPGTQSKAVFDFKNVGTETLEVYGANSTCGCLKPTFILPLFIPPVSTGGLKSSPKATGKAKSDKDKDYNHRLSMKGGIMFNDGMTHKPVSKDNPLILEPGESAQLEVAYKAGWSKSKLKKSLWLLSNDPDNPRAQLEIMGEVIVKVEALPEQVDLRLDQPNGGMKKIVLKSVDDQKFSIQEIRIPNSVMTIPFDPEIKAKKFILEATVDIEKLAQSSIGIIKIVTDHPNGDEPMIRYTTVPNYEVSNPRYILQNIEPGKSIFRDNRIKSNYGEKTEIKSVESRNGYMEIEEQSRDGDHIKLKIKITPPAGTSSKKRYITDELTITLKDGDQLTIRCSGWFRLKDTVDITKPQTEIISDGEPAAGSPPF